MATDAAPLTRDDLRDELQRALTQYATKADLADLRDELHRTHHGPWLLRDEGAIALTHYATCVAAEIQATRAEFKADLHSLTRWMVVAVMGSVTAAAAVTGLIVRFFS